MRKSNFITLALLILAVTVTAVFSLHGCSGKKEDNTIQDTQPVTVSQTESTTAEPTTAPSTSEPSQQSADPNALSKALFIGDSRTVGLREYAGLDNADFFATVGMSVFNAQKDRISVPKVGKVTLNELLSNKKYDKIYVMLGINELGYSFDSITSKYGELINFIKEKQPNATIIVQANLHVSKSRSDSDKVINNTAINRLNSELSKLADGKKVYYIDANPVFDDADGNLSADKTQDNAHLLAKYYAQWGEWICRKTSEIIKGE